MPRTSYLSLFDPSLTSTTLSRRVSRGWSFDGNFNDVAEGRLAFGGSPRVSSGQTLIYKAFLAFKCLNMRPRGMRVQDQLSPRSRSSCDSGLRLFLFKFFFLLFPFLISIMCRFSRAFARNHSDVAVCFVGFVLVPIMLSAVVSSKNS